MPSRLPKGPRFVTESLDADTPWRVNLTRHGTLFDIAFPLSDMYSLPVHALSFLLRMYQKQLLIKDLATQSISIEDSWRSVPLPPSRLFSRGGGIYANRSVWMW